MITNEFRRELTELISKHNLEEGSNTPDWILMEYLVQCLINFNMNITRREEWYSKQEINNEL